MAIPQTVERLSHGSPTFFAGGKGPKPVAGIVDDGFRRVAPKRLIAEHDGATRNQ